jgi:hypothetical protein
MDRQDGLEVKKEYAIISIEQVNSRRKIDERGKINTYLISCNQIIVSI